MKLFNWFSSSCCALLLVCNGCSPEPEGSKNPLAAYLPEASGKNLVVISFDALRADSLGVYGYERGTSPNIDAFAADALVFTQAVVAGKDTPTSFASAFTGELPFRVFRGWELQPVPTMANSFSEAGYATAAFMHNVQLVRERGFAQGFDTYEMLHSGRRADEEVIRAAASWLADRPDGPFFLWVHFITPHAPYENRDFANHFYDPGYEGPYSDSTPARVASLTSVSEADRDRIRDLYDGEVLYADKLFGQMMEALERNDARQDSVVVLTSDHGDALGEHGVYGHGTLFDEVLRVPLIIRHPGEAEAGRTDFPTANVDLYPTLATMFGIPYPEYMDGVDLLGSVWSERPLVSVAMTSGDYRALAVRVKGYKAIVTCASDVEIGTVELYDMSTDPGEERDVSERFPERTNLLLGHLRDLAGEEPCRTLTQAVQGKSIEHGMDEERIEQLRSLGYIQ